MELGHGIHRNPAQKYTGPGAGDLGKFSSNWFCFLKQEAKSSAGGEDRQAEGKGSRLEGLEVSGFLDQGSLSPAAQKQVWSRQACEAEALPSRKGQGS